MLTAFAIAALATFPFAQQPGSHASSLNGLTQSRYIQLPANTGTQVLTLDGRDTDGTWLVHHTAGYDRGVSLANRPSYPTGRADSVRRPGFNGGLWHGEVCIGGVDSWAVNTGSPGAAGYGASLQADQVASLRVGPYAVGVNPWDGVRSHGKEAQRHLMAATEDARNAWLKQAGYLGGVRTFQNDAATLGVMEKPQAIDMTPKAIIPSPTDEPKFKKRMEVKASPAPSPAPVTKPMMTLAGATYVSFPASVKVTAPKVMIAAKDLETVSKRQSKGLDP